MFWTETHRKIRIVTFRFVMFVTCLIRRRGAGRKLIFRLELHVVMAEWIKECVLLRRAIYRLSMSGHLLRFVVDRKLNLESQALRN